MLKFLSRKTKTEFVTPEFYKDWGNATQEIEWLGHRLDAVREAIKETKEGTWAHTHWNEVEAIILRKWKHTVRMKDVGLRQQGKRDTGPTIDYTWWERDDGTGTSGLPIFGFFNDMFTTSRSLDWSWEKARDEKLQKARQGMA